MFEKFHRPAPRYTSYPTAPEWGPLEPQVYAEKLSQIRGPLSLYFHIPFCHSMCLYCACSVVLNRKPENEERYVEYLMREIDLVCEHLGKGHSVTQVHFGGGTPTKLSIPLFSRLFDKINSSFSIDFSKEIAIEIDPRTVIEDGGKKLKFLKDLGFNRVSFGVQDTDPQVQEAVKRRQSYEMTKWTYDYARELGFDKINIDLIYGLPYQTEISFKETVSKILQMHPDRIALFSYAKVPWLKPHQSAIKDETLPSTEEKFKIYEQARQTFLENGYIAIGMDHFALEEDEIAICYHNKTLRRNFQGYTVHLADDAIGFGVTAIGFLQDCYTQNLKTLQEYYQSLDRGFLPMHKGKVLTEEDCLRKWVIHTLMCQFELDKEEFHARYGETFETHFPDRLDLLEADGLIFNTPKKVIVTPLGELFIRIVAMSFDAYLKNEPQPKFSKSV